MHCIKPSSKSCASSLQKTNLFPLLKHLLGQWIGHKCHDLLHYQLYYIFCRFSEQDTIKVLDKIKKSNISTHTFIAPIFDRSLKNSNKTCSSPWKHIDCGKCAHKICHDFWTFAALSKKMVIIYFFPGSN